MQDSKTKVLYIGGWGRSGSTILGNILGSIDGIFHAGELIHIWENGFLQNRACGCQLAFKDCPLWDEILTCAFGGRDKIDPRRMVYLRNRGPQNRAIPNRFRDKSGSSEQEFPKEYLDNLSRLYAAICDVTGSHMVVDSSKHPSYAYALCSAQDIDFYMLHLIRDSRATAYSWLRRVQRTDSMSKTKKTLYQEQFHPLSSALKWYGWNITLEMFRNRMPGQYERLFYEDFTDQPRQVVEQILRNAREDPANTPFTGDRTVVLKTNHTIWGNPVRTKVGEVEIRNDDEWKSKMRAADRLKVSAITWPLLLRYGYHRR